MCARRFLLVIFLITLLVAIGAFAIFQFGQDVLLKTATPKGHYVAPSAQAGPDYSRLSSWISSPALPDSPAEWLPEGMPEQRRGDRRAATFYVHPTTYLKSDRWNATIDDAESLDRAILFTQSQASAFNGVSEVWAPKYRQAAYGAFLLGSADAAKALDLAYSDVAAAFDNFLARVGPGRPIILAGHSQGALHLMRLLRDRRQALRKRLVAAYVVGWPVGTSADLPALGIPACGQPSQTGCLLSWMSFGDPANPGLILTNWTGTRGLAGGTRQRQGMLCVNPLTGAQGGSAPPSANPGTLVPSADMRTATLEPGKVGAHCEKGLLILDGEIPPLGPFVLPGNNYHVYDYALFWGAIRQDAERRMTAWR